MQKLTAEILPGCLEDFLWPIHKQRPSLRHGPETDTSCDYASPVPETGSHLDPGQLPVLGTGVAPCGYFPLSPLVPRDCHNRTGHTPASHSHHNSWWCISHGPFVAPMACPRGRLFCRAVAPGSQEVCRQLPVGQLRSCKAREREEKSHLSPSKLLLSLKSPTTDQNPQTLAESLWSLPLPRAPQMIANNGQPGPEQHTHVASCTDLLGSWCCFVYASFTAH